MSVIKLIILWIILPMGFIGCIGNGKKQQVVNQQTDRVIVVDDRAKNNKFDVAAFEQHEKDHVNDGYEEYQEILPNDTSVKYMKDKTEDCVQYIIIKRPKNSLLTYESVYYENGNLKSEKTYGPCYGMLIGVSRCYSIDGELEQEINEDDGYSFTFEQLMNLLNERGLSYPKGVLLDYRYQITKVRAGEEGKAYFVIYPLSHDTDLTITVNGKNGSIIAERRCIHPHY